MNILITGGAGFIGSHTAKKIQNNGHTVIIVDNFSTGLKENTKDFVYAYDLDITKDIELPFKEHKIDVVYHFAAHCNVRQSVKDPIKDAMINVIGSINVFEMCAKYKVKKIIFASSGGTVYGENFGFPSVTYDTTKPLCPYGAAKVACEQYLQYYHQAFNISTVILRYGNVYGFGQNASSEAGVISIFMGKMLNGENPTIFGNGEHIRDYIYIDDVVRINYQCLRDEFTNIIMNVGTGIQTTTNDIFRQINSLFDNKFEEKHISAQDGEIKVNYLFIDPLLKKPELIPKTKLKEGIEQTFKKYKEVNNRVGNL